MIEIALFMACLTITFLLLVGVAGLLCRERRSSPHDQMADVLLHRYRTQREVGEAKRTMTARADRTIDAVRDAAQQRRSRGGR